MQERNTTSSEFPVLPGMPSVGSVRSLVSVCHCSPSAVPVCRGWAGAALAPPGQVVAGRCGSAGAPPPDWFRDVPLDMGWNLGVDFLSSCPTPRMVPVGAELPTEHTHSLARAAERGVLRSQVMLWK